MAGENVGAERRRQKNNEVGNLHTCFRSPGSPVTNLVTEQPVRAMRHCESGTSVVQMGGGGSLKGPYPDGEDRCPALDWQ